MPDVDRNGRQQESVREAVAAGGHHEIQNEGIVDQANEDRELKAEPIRNAPAQEIADRYIQGRAQQGWQAYGENGRPESARRKPYQQGIEDVVIRDGRPWRIRADPPEVGGRFVERDGLEAGADNRQEDGEESGDDQRRLLPNAPVYTG